MHFVKRLGLLLAGVSALSLTVLSGVQAQLSPVGPFVGSLTETWEGFANYTVPGPVTYLADPTDIMGGAASISNPFMTVYEPGPADFGLGGSGPAQVSDGAKGMGVDGFDQTATIVFDDPVNCFGAYWGSGTFGQPNTIRLSFFDVFDNLIGNASFQYDHEANFDGVLDWHGWSSTTLIKSVAYTGDYVVIDGIQAHCTTVVPEPGTLAMLVGMGIGGALVLARRKRS
jgi:hypothetical protein